MKQNQPDLAATGTFGQTIANQFGSRPGMEEYTKNPLLDQSLNQREGSSRDQSNAAGEGGFNLNNYLREKLYLVINKFKDVCKGQSAATFEQFRQVFGELIVGQGNVEQELGGFWSRHSLDN